MEEEKEEELNFDLTQQNIIIPEETPSCNEVIGCSVRENITAILFVLPGQRKFTYNCVYCGICSKACWYFNNKEIKKIFYWRS